TGKPARGAGRDPAGSRGGHASSAVSPVIVRLPGGASIRSVRRRPPELNKAGGRLRPPRSRGGESMIQPLRVIGAAMAAILLGLAPVAYADDFANALKEHIAAADR